MSERGNLAEEYRAGRLAGLVEGRRSLFWVEGPDAVSFLQGIITQDVEAMAPGDVARSMLLEPRGKLVSLMWILRGEGRVGIVTDQAVFDTTIETLGKWRFRVDAELRPDPRPIVEVWGSQARSVVTELAPIPDGWNEIDSLLVAVVPLGPIDRILLAGSGVAAIEAAGATKIGDEVAETIRLESGEPLMGHDLDGNTIPQESGLVDASVSFSKGCYLGQELVARIDTRGRVNRRLVGLRFEGTQVPPIGASVVGMQRQLGQITSVAQSVELAAPIAIGLIRREAATGSTVTVEWDGGQVGAVVVDLPMVGAA